MTAADHIQNPREDIMRRQAFLGFQINNDFSSASPSGVPNYLKPIQHSPPSIALYGTSAGLGLASVDFATELDAAQFWSVAKSGSLQIYGQPIGAVPDPSGLRVYGGVCYF